MSPSDVFEPAEFASIFFFSFVKKEKGKRAMRAVVVEKQRGRSKSVKARRAYVCFLEREVYTFCNERVRGAMPRARIFFVCGKAAEGDVDGRQQAGRRWTAGGTCGIRGQNNIR